MHHLLRKTDRASAEPVDSSPHPHPRIPVCPPMSRPVPNLSCTQDVTRTQVRLSHA